MSMEENIVIECLFNPPFYIIEVVLQIYTSKPLPF